MKRTSALFAPAVLALLALITTASAQPLWERQFGGDDAESARVVLRLRDGGTLVAGYSYSEPSGSKSAPHFGEGDLWLLKLGADGAKQWDAACGGAQFESAQAAVESADGTVLVGGVSFSGMSGVKTTPSFGAEDFWLVKFSASGAVLWERTFGGTSSDVVSAVRRTTDGGIVLAGTSASAVSGNKTSPGFGGRDYWVLKLDASGNKLWERAFGGIDEDTLTCAEITGDGGLLIGGSSVSAASGNKSSAALGATDFWVLKLDASGNKQCERTLGGDGADELRSIVALPNGFLLAGTSASGASPLKRASSFGGRDYWLTRSDAAGNPQWDVAFGGSSDEELQSVELTVEGGFLLSGSSFSGVSGNKQTVAGAAGGAEQWIVKMSASGGRQWEHALRVDSAAESSVAHLAADNGYVVAGTGSNTVANPDILVAKHAPPICLTAMARIGPGQLSTQVIGIPGARYALEWTTNWQHWTPLQTNSAPDGVVRFQWSAPAAPLRFYRASRR